MASPFTREAVQVVTAEGIMRRRYHLRERERLLRARCYAAGFSSAALRGLDESGTLEQAWCWVCRPVCPKGVPTRHHALGLTPCLGFPGAETAGYIDRTHSKRCAQGW